MCNVKKVIISQFWVVYYEASLIKVKIIFKTIHKKRPIWFRSLMLFILWFRHCSKLFKQQYLLPKFVGSLHWYIRVYFLGCVHRRNPYIRFISGFQYGRFSCDGFRYIIVMHCIVNVEPPILTFGMFTSDKVFPVLHVIPVMYRTENCNNNSILCYNNSLKDKRKWITPHLFVKIGYCMYYSPSSITLVNDAVIFLLMMLVYHII